MNVSYTQPLQHAWVRMTRMLFQPFRIDFWLTLGFAAFLSEYLSHAGAGGKYSWHGRAHGPIGEAGREMARFLLHPIWGPLAIAIAALLVIAALVFLWFSSRGKFIFLDDVVNERAAIVEPWHHFARQGNALYAFWLGLTIVSIALFIMILIPVLPAVLAAIASGEPWREVLGAFAVTWWVAAMVPFGIVVAYTHLFLFHFVVPIMAHHGIGVFEAWSRFLALFRTHALYFLGYGLFMLMLYIALGIAIVFAGLVTCCVGFLVLSIPYVGSVVLLPVEVTFRGLGPDFLAQFGPEWVFAPRPAATLPPTGPPVTGAGA